MGRLWAIWNKCGVYYQIVAQLKCHSGKKRYERSHRGELTSLIMSRISLAQFALCWIPKNMEGRVERRVCVCVCVTEGSVDESQRDRQRWSESEGMSLHRLTNPARDDLPGCPLMQARPWQQAINNQYVLVKLIPLQDKKVNKVHLDHSCDLNKDLSMKPHAERWQLCTSPLCHRGKVYDCSDNRVCDTSVQEKDYPYTSPSGFLPRTMCESPNNTVFYKCHCT